MLWPMLLDYTRNECKRYLRKLELEAYASIVSAFRAQGELSKEKKKMLHDLCSVLSISMERHKAEIRRAVNDEKLNTIADRMVGPNTGTDWAIEGRRLVPLMPRLVPQTAFTALANNLANLQAAKNATMPMPSATGQQIDESGQEESKASCELSSPLPGSIPTTPVKGAQHLVSLTSPDASLVKAASTQNTLQGTTATANNNTISSDSGNILVCDEEQETEDGPKRKRSASLDSTSQIPAKVLVTSAIPPGPPSGAGGGGGGGSTSPIIMTSTASSRTVHGLPTRGQHIHKTTIQGTQGGSKVILVSGTSSSLPPSILQRCLSVPMSGKALSTPVSSATYKSTATSTYSLASSSSATAMSTVSSLLSSPLTTSSAGSGTGSMLVYTTSRPRSRGGTTTTTIRPTFRARAITGANLGALGQPGGPGTVQFPTPSSSALKTQSGVQKSTTTYLRAPGVKILSQMMKTCTSRSVPAQSPTSFSVANVISKPAQANQSAGSLPRIVNVMSVNPSSRGGTSLISARLPTPSKLGQAIASRISSASGGAKPNVIVVHKAQVWPQQQQQQLTQGTAFVVTKSGQTFKDIVTYSQKQQQALLKSGGAGISVMKPSLAGLAQTRTVQTASNTVTITTTTSMPSTSSPSSSILELDPSQLDEQKNTLLADLIQAAGIAPDAAAAAAAAVVSVAMETFPPQMQTTTVTTTIASSAPPVSLVSSVSTTPCLAQVQDQPMDTDEPQTATNSGDESLASLQLGDLISQVPVSFSSEDISVASLSTPIVSATVSSTKSAVSTTTEATVPSTTTPKPVSETLQVKASKVELNQGPSVSLQEIEMPLEQLQGGQVLEIQAPDAAALLNSDGQLSKEVLEILHQAGFQLQNDQVTIDTSGLELSGTTMELHLEGASEEPSDKKKEETSDDSSAELVYLSESAEDQKKDDSKDDGMPSIVNVFSSGVLGNSQLDLESLRLVEDVLVQKAEGTPVIQTSLLQDESQMEATVVDQEVPILECSSSCGASAPQTFLGMTNLHTELGVMEETASDSANVVVESTDKSYLVPSMSIDNVIEVGSTELVISGQDVQDDTNNIMTSHLLDSI